MSTTSGSPHDQRPIDAYLDAEMTPEQRADFEQEHVDEVAAVRRITSATRRLYAAPEFGSIELPAPGAPAVAVAGRIGPVTRWASMAAAVALLVVGGLLLVRPGGGSPTGPDVRMAQLFYARQSANMQPEVVCDTHEKFLNYTREVYAEPIAARFDAGVELIGWRALDGPYPSAGELDDARRVLLARAHDGTPIIAVARFASDDLPLGTSGPDVNVHEFELAGVVFTEFSPLDDPLLEGALYLDQP